MAGNCILTAGSGPRQQGLYDRFVKPFLAFQNLEITIDFAHGNLFLHSGIDIWQEYVLIRDIFTHFKPCELFQNFISMIKKLFIPT